MLAATLFTLYLAAVLDTMNNTLVYIRSRLDGKMFSLAQLKPPEGLETVCVRELPSADDATLLAKITIIQDITNRVASGSTQLG